MESIPSNNMYFLKKASLTAGIAEADRNLDYRAESSQLGSEALQLELIVCDMNQAPRVAIAAVQPLLSHLTPGGFLVMTCKLYGTGRNRCAVLFVL